MLSNILNNKNHGNKKKNGKRNGNQTAKAGYSYAVNNGPIRSPPMPNEFSVSLVNRQTLPQTVPTGATTRFVFPLLEYLNKRPLYMQQFYAMYKYSRVLSVNYHFEIMNTGTAPFEFAFAFVPFEDVISVGLSQLIDKPGSVRKLVSSQGGLDRATLNKFGVAQQWMGNPYNTKDYWVTEAQSTALVPLDQAEPTGLLIVEPTIAGSGITWSLVTKITYNIQFFDLEIPALSLNVQLLDDESEEMEVVQTPTAKKLAKAVTPFKVGK